MSLNISPEEILKQKELLGGIKYDDPVQNQTSGVTQLTRDVEIPATIKKETPLARQPESINESTVSPKSQLASVPPQGFSTTLGKAQTQASPADSGWKNLPLNLLPTGGDYYPEGTRIAIRAAEVREIRHFSTIDDEDRLDIEEKLSYILDRCCRIDFQGEGVVSYKDLKQEDRFFVIMAIRDLTFVKGENSIILKPYKTCQTTPDCPYKDGIELRTGALSSYKIDSQIFKYYNSGSRSFIFTIKSTGKKIALHIPSIGVTEAVSSFVVSQTKKGTPPDDAFLKLAPFLFADWRGLNDSSILNKMREIDYWSKEEFSLVFELTERIKLGTKLEVTQNCPVCGGEEVTAEISFPSGLRSLFVISDIFRELL